MDVDLHPGNRINQGEYVRAAGLSRPGHLRDVRDVGAQLHDHRLLRVALHFPRDGLQGVRFLAEGDAALLDIRAGDIDLQHIYRLIRQALHHLAVVLHGLSADVDNDFRVVLLQKRKIPLKKHVDARILKADGVQHAALRLRDAGHRIARPGHVRHALGDNSA